MSPRITALGIDRMPIEERIELAGEIWEGIAEEEAQLPISDALRAELEQRLALLDADPYRGTPWEEVNARALARFQR